MNDQQLDIVRETCARLAAVILQQNNLLEMILSLAARPLYNELEVGFRHSPLTNAEKLRRYEETCEHIAQLAEGALKNRSEK